jgi:hypothetical protein
MHVFTGGRDDTANHVGAGPAARRWAKGPPTRARASNTRTIRRGRDCRIQDGGAGRRNRTARRSHGACDRIEAYSEGKLSKADFKLVQKQLADAETPDGALHAKDKQDYVDRNAPVPSAGAEPGTGPDQGTVDPAAIIRRYDLERRIDQKIDRYRKEGKDPGDLFDPTKPHYIGGTETLAPFLPAGTTEADAIPSSSSEKTTPRLVSILPDLSTPYGPRPFRSPNVTPFPGPGPLFPAPGSKEWTDYGVRGYQGLLDALRSLLRRSKAKEAEEEDDDFCHRRFAQEQGRCYKWKWQIAHPDYFPGCMDRAKYRRDMCIRNGGQPHPDEPPEWRPGPDYDEETWRNPNR